MKEWSPRSSLSSSYDAFCQLRRTFLRSPVEELWILSLSRGLLLIRSQMLFRGTADACTVHPRDIFRFACLTNASFIILAHNHPSRSLTPSREDLLFTQRIIEAGNLFQIPLLDHLLVSPTEYKSFADQKWINFQTGEISDRFDHLDFES